MPLVAWRHFSGLPARLCAIHAGPFADRLQLYLPPTSASRRHRLTCHTTYGISARSTSPAFPAHRTALFQHHAFATFPVSPAHTAFLPFIYLPPAPPLRHCYLPSFVANARIQPTAAHSTTSGTAVCRTLVPGLSARCLRFAVRVDWRSFMAGAPTTLALLPATAAPPAAAFLPQLRAAHYLLFPRHLYYLLGWFATRLPCLYTYNWASGHCCCACHLPPWRFAHTTTLHRTCLLPSPATLLRLPAACLPAACLAPRCLPAFAASSGASRASSPHSAYLPPIAAHLLLSGPFLLTNTLPFCRAASCRTLC